MGSVGQKRRNSHEEDESIRFSCTGRCYDAVSGRLRSQVRGPRCLRSRCLRSRRLCPFRFCRRFHPCQGWKFDRRVEIMIPAKEGGLDTTIRAFAPYLEKELGTNVVINNKDGASGTAGYTWSHNSVNDGYAFQFTAPSAILADAQGVCSFDLMSELIPVSGLTSADGLLFASKVAPFTTVEEMIDYAKANPGEVTIVTDSPKGISGAMIAEFCD